MQIAQLIDQFILWQQKQHKSENTLKNYRTDLTCFLEYLYDTQEHDDISHYQLSHILQYGDYLSKRFKSDNSRRRRVQTLRIFFDFLVGQQVVKENWVRQIPVSPKFLDIPKPTPLKDVQMLWQHLTNQENLSKEPLEHLVALRNQIIFLLIYGAALKVAQLEKLKLEHITIGQRPRVLIIPKKRDPYSIGLPKIFHPIFLNYKKELLQQQQRQQRQDPELLFYANPYKIIAGGLSARGLELLFKQWKSDLGIELLTPKALRTACIFRWIHLRHSDKNIKEWLGVAPSYSLAIYHQHKNLHLYNSDFL